MRSTGAWWLSVLLAGPAMAEQVQARFQVSAVVPPRAVLTSSDWPAGLELTEQDVRQGYKDVAARFEAGRDGGVYRVHIVVPLAA